MRTQLGRGPSDIDQGFDPDQPRFVLLYGSLRFLHISLQTSDIGVELDDAPYPGNGVTNPAHLRRLRVLSWGFALTQGSRRSFTRGLGSPDASSG
jgi:hypothetical protein